MIYLSDCPRCHRRRGRRVIRTGHSHRVGARDQITIAVAHGHREGVRGALADIQGLDGRGVLGECVGAAGGVQRQRAVGAQLAHRAGRRTRAGGAANDAIGQCLAIHIGAHQRANQAEVGRPSRLVHLGNSARVYCAQGRRIIRTGHAHRVGARDQVAIPITHGHREGVRAALAHVQGLDGRCVLGERVDAVGGVHRQPAKGTHLAHRVRTGGAADEAVGQRLDIHIGTEQRAAEACVGRRGRLIHLGNRSYCHRCQGRCVIRTGHRYRVALGHQGAMTVTHRQSKSVCTYFSSI